MNNRSVYMRVVPICAAVVIVVAGGMLVYNATADRQKGLAAQQASPTDTEKKDTLTQLAATSSSPTADAGATLSDAQKKGLLKSLEQPQ